MTGCTVKPTQQVGLARDAQEAAPRRAQRVGDGVAERPHVACSSSSAASARVAGQRQEHVVERRAPQRDVVDADAAPRRAAAPPRRSLPLRWRSGTRSDVRPRATARSSDIGASAATAAVACAAVVQPDLEALAADAVLELVGRALGDDAAVVDDRDPVGEAVGLVEVLRRQQHGRAAGDERPRWLPEPEPAARVEAGGRLVEEEHRRAGDERGGEVEPAAHAARVGRGRAARPASARSKRSSSSRAALAGRSGAEVVEAADHLEVLEAREVLVDRRVLAGEADPLAQLRRRRGRRRARRRARCRRRARAASSGCAPRSSCRRRWGRAARGRCPPRRRRSTPSRATTSP